MKQTVVPVTEKLGPFKLTHVDTQFEKLGDIAAQHMARHILDEEPINLSKLLEVRLVEGQSCGPVL